MAQNKGKPTIGPENHDENVGQRGGGVKGSGGDETPSREGTSLEGDGLKKHGDDLEEAIPGKTEATDKPTAAGRPVRDDGDNDDMGEPGSAKSGSVPGYRDPNRKR